MKGTLKKMGCASKWSVEMSSEAFRVQYWSRAFGKVFEQFKAMQIEAREKGCKVIEIVDATKEREAYDRGYQAGIRFQSSVMIDEVNDLNKP